MCESLKESFEMVVATRRKQYGPAAVAKKRTRARRCTLSTTDKFKNGKFKCARKGKRKCKYGVSAIPRAKHSGFKCHRSRRAASKSSVKPRLFFTKGIPKKAPYMSSASSNFLLN